MNWWGIPVSFGYVFAFIGVAQLLLERGHLSPDVTRKVIHIGVSHWWLLAMLFFDRWEFAIVGPLAFIFINLASYLFRLFPAMEHPERRRNLGTVYFPISLLVLVLLFWAGPLEIWMGGVGILVLGWGDGLAALVGEKTRGRTFRVYGSTKSVAGTLTMLIAASAVAAVFLAVYSPGGVLGIGGAPGIVLGALLVGVVSSAVELATPWGVDNLTVPLVTAFLVYLV